MPLQCVILQMRDDLQIFFLPRFPVTFMACANHGSRYRLVLRAVQAVLFSYCFFLGGWLCWACVFPHRAFECFKCRWSSEPRRCECWCIQRIALCGPVTSGWVFSLSLLLLQCCPFRRERCQKQPNQGETDKANGLESQCLALTHGSYSCLSRAVNVQ